MGKGRIKSKLEPEGLYVIEIDGVSDITDRISRIDNMIDTCDNKISEGGENAGIYQLRKAEYQKEKSYFQNVQDSIEYGDRLAWCIDYEEIPAGTLVGLIEIDRENTGEVLNIRGNYESGAAYDADNDGVSQAVPAMNPFAQYYNLAISPGVQKWYPRYRHGTIFNIDYDNDTCSVNYEILYANSGNSGENPLNMNLQEGASGVPIEYMNCNASAFEIGDEVVVEFTGNDWASPVVRGFKTNPQPCETHELVFVRLGELGFIWDMETDDYYADLPGINSYSACYAIISSRLETTWKYDEFDEPLATKAFPYQKSFYQMYDDPGYEINTNNYIVLGHPNFGESDVCGDIFTNYSTDDFEECLSGGGDEAVCFDSHLAALNSGMWPEEGNPKSNTRTYAPVESFLGTLKPGFTFGDYSYWVEYSYYPWDGEYVLDESEGSQLESYLGTYHDIVGLGGHGGHVCPIDFNESYYNLCSEAEYGNDPLNLANNGFRFSKKTLVQILWDCHFDSKATTSTRTTTTHCACSYYPWIDPTDSEATIQNPIEQQRNDAFSTAFYDLVEQLHIDRGYGDQAIPWGDIVWADGYSEGSCINGYTSKPYWSYIVDPEFEVKIYRK